MEGSEIAADNASLSGPRATLTEGVLKAMPALQFKPQAAILFTLFGLCGAVSWLSPAVGQSTTEETKGVAKVSTRKSNATDQDQLQGKWQLSSIDIAGTVYKREDKLDGWKETFAKEVLIRGDRLTHGQAAGEGKFKLDDTQDPKQITFQDKAGKLTFLGIYSLEGDTLKVCINGNGTDSWRPKEFVAGKGKPIILLTLNKQPAK